MVKVVQSWVINKIKLRKFYRAQSNPFLQNGKNMIQQQIMHKAINQRDNKVRSKITERMGKFHK